MKGVLAVLADLAFALACAAGCFVIAAAIVLAVR